MKTIFFGFLVFLLLAVLANWYFFCEIRNQCGEEEVISTRAKTLSLTEADSIIILKDYEQFLFDSAGIQPDLNENNLAFLQGVIDYLNNNSEKNLTIVGHYLESEADASSGIFENVGVARAIMIEKQMEAMGVDETRIDIDHNKLANNTLGEPISFNVYEASATDEYSKLQFRFEDMTYTEALFDYNSDEFAPKDQFHNYLDSLKVYFDSNLDKMLVITGHTDSIASQKYNYDLGLRRAQNAADYLEQEGIEIEIDVDSKGELEPVNPNTKADGTDNEEGRQKNRRVNFKIISKNE